MPALAKRSRGHTEIIRDNFNGFIYDNKDELVEKILNLYSNENILDELRKNARDSVQKYTLKNAFNEMIKIYNDEGHD